MLRSLPGLCCWGMSSTSPGLCILVLYYLVALHFTSLQDKAEMGDYIIGACLFLLGTFLLFAVVRRLSESPGQDQAAGAEFDGRGWSGGESLVLSSIRGDARFWCCSAVMGLRAPMCTRTAAATRRR